MVLEQDYDCICIDSPPVMPVSDAELLSTMVHGVVLVVDAQTTPKQTVKEARARLTYARANLLGVVLNRMTDKRTDYGYYANVYPTQTKRRRSL
jgi:Mrp family chromosome partitioning ATPase